MSKNYHASDKDEESGAQLLFKALEAPLKAIAENAGVSGEVVVDKVRASKDNFGYNAKTDTYENPMEAGVIDPVSVTQAALDNAVSVAKMILTTQCAIAYIENDANGPEEEYDPEMITV